MNKYIFFLSSNIRIQTSVISSKSVQRLKTKRRKKKVPPLFYEYFAVKTHKFMFYINMYI